jgi:hypothetical protein
MGQTECGARLRLKLRRITMEKGAITQP